MKICRICMNNDILCGACNAKVEKGEISRLDVSVYRAMKKAGIDADFEKAVENREFILIVSGDARKFIGRGGRSARKMEECLGKKVRIIERAGNKSMAEQVLSTPIIGINVLYSGEEKLRIRVQDIYRRKISTSAVNLLETVLGRKTEVVYE